jgi:hypothetical protein
MTELTSTQQQVLVSLANGSTMTAAAKEVGADRNTVSDWRRTIPEFRKSFAVAQYEQALYWREQLQSLGTLAITCLKQAMMDNSGNLNLRAAVVVLDRITKTAPEQPELAGQRQASNHKREPTPPPTPRPDAENPAAPAQSRTTDPPAAVPDLEAGRETPEPHKLHNHAQPNRNAGRTNPSAPPEESQPSWNNNQPATLRSPEGAMLDART